MIDAPPPTIPEGRAAITRTFQPAWLRDCTRRNRTVTCTGRWHVATLMDGAEEHEWWVVTRIRARRDRAGRWTFDVLKAQR